MRLCASRLRGRPFVVYLFRMRSAYARFNGSAVQYRVAAAGNIVGGVGREGRGEELMCWDWDHRVVAHQL
jgi:hypothetical protein